MRLQFFLETVLSKHATESTQATIINTTVGDNTKNLSTGKAMPELTYYHTEADTAMFTIYNILRLQGYSSPVILDTEDTDNYVQAAHIAHRITGDLYIKRKQQFIYQCIYTV